MEQQAHHSGHPAAPGGTVASPAPRSEPRAVEGSELPAKHTPGPLVRFHTSARRGLYGIQPVDTRHFRGPSIAEVVHFETCHAAGAFSAVNVQVPQPVPVWQYVAADERAAAARKCAAVAKVAP